MLKVLVFSPHPDDDVIGCGGSIAKHVKNGHVVSIVYMTSGDAGSLTRSKEELSHMREGEAKEAARVLGATKTILMRQPDGYLSYNKAPLAKLVSLIREMRPNVIYLPHEEDGNEDHRVTAKLVREAVHRAAGPWFQECPGDPWDVDVLLAYEVWTPLRDVSYTENITAFKDTKLNALRKHVSQIDAISYDDAVEGLNRFRGALLGTGLYCECFNVIRANMQWEERP
jgi:LmbE family N-acetylglucosaminyl deacetylase